MHRKSNIKFAHLYFVPNAVAYRKGFSQKYSSGVATKHNKRKHFEKACWKLREEYSEVM